MGCGEYVGLNVIGGSIVLRVSDVLYRGAWIVLGIVMMLDGRKR